MKGFKAFTFLLCFSLFPTAPSWAGGIPVYSAVEHLQSVAGHVARLQDALVQVEKLGLMDSQLLTDMEHLVLQYERFDQQVRNAISVGQEFYAFTQRDYSSLSSALRNIMAIKDRVEQLDPNNVYFDQVMTEQIDEQYAWAAINISETFESNVSGYDKATAMIDAYKEVRSEHERALEARAIKRSIADQRMEQIDAYQTQLNNLDDNSALQTQQINAQQTNMMLRQQEVLMSRIDAINKRDEDREMQSVAEKQRVLSKRVEQINAIRNRTPLGMDLE